VLEGVGGCWRVLEGVGGCWRVLEDVGGCWRVLEGVGGCSVLLLLRTLSQYFTNHAFSHSHTYIFTHSHTHTLIKALVPRVFGRMDPDVLEEREKVLGMARSGEQLNRQEAAIFVQGLQKVCDRSTQ
jgi:hypothetical protein